MLRWLVACCPPATLSDPNNHKQPSGRPTNQPTNQPTRPTGRSDSPYDTRYRPGRLLLYDKYPGGGIGLAAQVRARCSGVGGFRGTLEPQQEIVHL
jgi:hypothetical protein